MGGNKICLVKKYVLKARCSSVNVYYEPRIVYPNLLAIVYKIYRNLTGPIIIWSGICYRLSDYIPTDVIMAVEMKSGKDPLTRGMS